MTERRFDWFPITLERQRGPQPPLYLGYWATYDDKGTGDGPQVTFSMDQHGWEWIVAKVVTDTPEQFTFVTDVHDETITFRHTIPADAAAAAQIDSPMPLPVEIIGAIMNGNTDLPTLAAAVDSAGTVHTMILETGLGLYARYGGVWLRMTDISPIEQLDIVDVDPQDLVIYDEADQAGNVLSYRDLTVIDAPAPGVIEPPVQPVPTAAGTVIVASAADLPDAIAWANEHEDARWYVGRRAVALGHKEPLPWE